MRFVHSARAGYELSSTLNAGTACLYADMRGCFARREFGPTSSICADNQERGMSDGNQGGNFGDGNFAEYIARERDRLRAEREQIFTQQEELQRQLDTVNREFAAIEAYEGAKTGKAGRQQAPAGRQSRARRGSRRG